MGRYSPWRHVHAMPHLRLVHERLDGLDSLYDPAEMQITLDSRLGQAERRCALAHELVHAEEGHEAQACPVLAARQERMAEQVAASRLILLEELANAMVWAHDERQLAEELWVDVDTVLNRLRGLTDQEWAYLNARIDSLGESA